MATAGSESTNETTNFARLSRLLVDICGQALGDLLTVRIPTHTFNHVIKTQRHILWRILLPEQRNLLFPPGGQFSGTYEDFDVTLLYSLLRSVGNISPHISGWGNPPDNADRSLSANIDRIRVARNHVYGHARTASVSDTDFNTYWNEIYQSVDEINSNYKESMDKLKTAEMDPEDVKRYAALLLAMSQKEDDVKSAILQQSGHIEEVKFDVHLLKGHVEEFTSEMRQLKGTVETIATKMEVSEETKMRYGTIGIFIEKSKCRLNQKLRQSDWIKINAYDAVMERLKERGFVVIKGLPGNGKTTLACHIINNIINGNHAGMLNKQPMLITKPSEWEDYVNPHNNLVIFIDNMFGTYGMGKVKEWKQVLETVSDSVANTQHENNNLLLVTQRTEVYNESFCVFHNHPLFQSVVDLTDEHNFTREDKLTLFKQYTKTLICEFTSEDENAIVKASGVIGFPQCCSLFRNYTKLQQNGPKFFSNPVHLLQTHLKEMMKIENEKFCSLALIMMNGGKLHESEFERHFSEIINKISVFYTLDNRKTEVIGKKLYSNARLLVGTYLSYSDQMFTFLHESIHHAVAMVLWDENKMDVVEKCSPLFLPLIQLDSADSSVVVAPNYIYPFLADRVMKELNKSLGISYKCIAEMKMWKKHEFVKEISEHEANCDWNKNDENGCSVLYYVTESQNIPLINYLLTKSASQVHLNSALTVDCELPDLSLFHIFLSQNAQITFQTAFSALRGDNKNIFKQVIEKDIDMIQHTKSKQFPHWGEVNFLQELCLSGNFEFFKVWVLKHGDEAFIIHLSECLIMR